MREVWKDVVGYEEKYEVSSIGNVKSKNIEVNHYCGGKRKVTGINLSKCERSKKTRYLCVVLYKNGIRKMFNVHTIVARAFIPNPKNKPQVNHKNGNRKDNRAENLEWCTSSYNVQHGFDKNGRTVNRGEKNGHCKLTEKKVKKIILLSNKGYTQKELSKIFNVSSSNIYMIKTRKNWKWVTI